MRGGEGSFNSPLRHVWLKPWSERRGRCGRGFVVSELMRPQVPDLGFRGVLEGWTAGRPSMVLAACLPWSEACRSGRGVNCK